jgi:hypothetical protein
LEFSRHAAAEVLRRYPDNHLLILVRGGRGPELAAELATETANPHVSAISCDLAVPEDIRTAAALIGRQVDTGQIPPLRGYVGGAGLMSSGRTPDGVDVYTYNPGGVPGTGLYREESPAMERSFQLLVRALCLTPYAMDLPKAGVLLAEAAAGPRPGPNGSYIDRGRITPSSPASYDREREDELWDTAARLCGLDTAKVTPAG